MFLQSSAGDETEFREVTSGLWELVPEDQAQDQHKERERTISEFPQTNSPRDISQHPEMEIGLDWTGLDLQQSVESTSSVLGCPLNSQ